MQKKIVHDAARTTNKGINEYEDSIDIAEGKYIK